MANNTQSSGPSPTILGVYDQANGATHAIDNNGKTTDTHLLLNGYAVQPYGWVIIMDGTVELGRVQANGSGRWTFMNYGVALSEGHHVLTAVSGENGNGSPPFNVDVGAAVVPTPAPSIEHAYDDTGAVDHGTTTDTHPKLTGTAPADSWVTIMNGTTELGKVQADGKGQWTFTDYKIDLGEGVNHITAVVDGVSSPTYDVTVHVPVPPADEPVIDYADDHVNGSDGELHNHDLTQDRAPTLHGTGEPDTVVTIWQDQRMVGTAKVHSDGSWTFPLSDLLGGPHEFQVRGADGAISDPFEIIVDPRIFPPVSIESGQESTGSGLASGETTDDPHPILSGTLDLTSPWVADMAGNVWITILDNGNKIGEVQPEGDGSWNYQLDLGPGDHHITAQLGDSPASNTFDIIETATAPAPVPTIDGVFDDAGASVGHDTSDTHPTLKGTAEGGSWVTIKDGANELGTVQADASGHWTLSDYPGVLPDGLHHFTAVSQAGTSAVFDVDVHASTPPITEPTPSFLGATVDDVYFASGQWMENVRPTLHGKNAGAYGVVTIMDDGHFVGTVTASASGSWHFPMDKALVDGMHHFTAQVGNGPESKPFDIGVVTAPPSIIGLYDATDGETYFHGGIVISDEHPMITGKAPLGTLHVTLMDDNNQVIGTADVDKQGYWTLSPELGNGPHHLTVISDNGRPSTASFDVTVEDHSASTHQADAPSLNDVLIGSEAELFAADHEHDKATLNVHDLDAHTATVDSIAVNGVNSPVQDATSLNTNLVLPHEQMHTHAV